MGGIINGTTIGCTTLNASDDVNTDNFKFK